MLKLGRIRLNLLMNYKPDIRPRGKVVGKERPLLGKYPMGHEIYPNSFEIKFLFCLHPPVKVSFHFVLTVRQ